MSLWRAEFAMSELFIIFAVKTKTIKGK